MIDRHTKRKKKQNMKMGTSLASPMVRTWRFHCHGSRGLIPGQETKILQVQWHSRNKTQI